MLLASTAWNAFQFTPLREGRHNRQSHRAAGQPISIHAPPRGATDMHFREADAEVVFQFTPLREGRHICTGVCGASTLFQFTPLREGRQHKNERKSTYMNFNSRPSARGDRGALRLRMQPNDFNSRPSARGDCTSWEGKAMNKLFQFTPLREGRPSQCNRNHPQPHFNSRPSARGDMHCV